MKLSLPSIARPGNAGAPATQPVDPATAQIDPATAQIDPATAQIDPATAQIDPATAQIDPATAPPDPTTPFIDPTTPFIDPADPTAATAAATLPTAEPLPTNELADPPAAASEPFAPPVVIGQVLPMYFVGDESHSMAGAPIAAVNQGLVDLRDEVAKHPLIGKKVRFGIITFADTAQTRLELSELSEELVLPKLAPRGRGTSYAAALEALRQAIPADVALLKRSGYQVHRPSVFFLSDGQPTEKDDKWQAQLAQLCDPSFNERPNILAFGVGDAEAKVIGQLASSPRYAFMITEGVSTAGAIAEFATSMLNSMVASAERLERGERTIEFERPAGFVALDAPLI